MRNTASTNQRISLFTAQARKLDRVRRGKMSEYIQELIDSDTKIIKRFSRKKGVEVFAVDTRGEGITRILIRLYPSQAEKLNRVQKRGISAYIRALIDEDAEIIKLFLK